MPVIFEFQSAVVRLAAVFTAKLFHVLNLFLVGRHRLLSLIHCQEKVAVGISSDRFTDTFRRIRQFVLGTHSVLPDSNDLKCQKPLIFLGSTS